MIQAVADDEERGELGMHYTSVPNILKVLNPLFLANLREKLAEAGDNPRKLLNLRNRMARIRVFDPACGSGNFLVIAYKAMWEIEAEINEKRRERGRRSDIPLTNFRGIELRDFPAEIARLALIIAEYQCDVLHRGQQEALAEFLPLDAMNWITCGNALRLDWLKLCPPTGTGVRHTADDLFESPLDQAEIEFENEGGETYICSNPPYRGSQWQTPEQKADLQAVFGGRTKHWKSLDYVSGWFMKAADYGTRTDAITALVSTNSICQGRQAGTLWPLIFAARHEIAFAHTSFKWANLAVFLGEDCWHAIRISGGMLDKIKFIAAYRTQPVSAITHYAPVSHIEPYGEGGKYKVVFSEKAKPIGPVPYGDAPPGAIQGPRYTSFVRLQKARKLTDVLGGR